MRISVVSDLSDISPETYVVCPIFEGDTSEDLEQVVALGGDHLGQLIGGKALKRGLYDITTIPPSGAKPGLLLIGMGDAKFRDGYYLLRLSSAASRYLSARGYAHLAFVNRGITSAGVFGQASVDGAIRGSYDSALLKSNKEVRPATESISLISPSATASDVEKGAEFGRVAGDASGIARDLVNLPPNSLTPTSFAKRAEALCHGANLEFQVLDRAAMAKRGMGSLLGVASGSDESPCLIILRYGDPSAETKLALVGKGITFDSGGLSLKTAEGMETMKGDMGGGAAVMAGMAAIARLSPPNVCVTAYIGATENMPGGHSMRPGDVLTAMNGETIEVLNTDAEGRLVLADLLAYAVSEGATHLVDFATLTGGAVVALGSVCTLATGSPDEWVAQVVEAGRDGLERAWQMPLFPEYRKTMDSDIADIKNSGGRSASALTASAFLRDFVGSVPWAHMDIAGTAFADDSSPDRPKGGTGEGVATILSLTRIMSEKAQASDQGPTGFHVERQNPIPS